MKYLIEYCLPNQSHLFSDPMRYEAKDGYDLSRVLSIAEQSNYDVIAVYEIKGEGCLAPII